MLFYLCFTQHLTSFGIWVVHLHPVLMAWLVWRELMLKIISHLSVINIYYILKND